MKKLISLVLYYMGDSLSFFLRFNALSFLYPLYSKIMLTSCDLDEDNKVWHCSSKLSDKQMDELIKEVKKQKWVKKRKLHK